VYDPKKSPFRKLRALRWLPSAITSRRIFRRWLSKLVKFSLKFKGYFDLYNIPFEHISLFDFTEKKSPLKPGGMNRGANIFDFLTMRGIAHSNSDPARSEDENLASLLADVEAERVDFAFVYWPELDGLMHRVGNQSSEVPRKLMEYEQRLERLLRTCRKHYQEVRLYVFGDHGMANCTEFLDLKAQVAELGLRMGKDYAVVYDSTMARFWFFNERARRDITSLLHSVPAGRIVPEQELREWQVGFEDHYFGELIFLVKEGVLIVPSDMGERPLRAMHGYHPMEKHSHAALFTNQEQLPEDVNAIPDMFRLMVRDAQEAQARNHSNGQPTSQPESVPPAVAEPEPVSVRI
jgi:hypothetical protein